jgi:class 3 adenylate cyclase
VDREVEMSFKEKGGNVQLSALFRALLQTPPEGSKSTSQSNDFLYKALLAVKQNPYGAVENSIFKPLFEGTPPVPTSPPGFRLADLLAAPRPAQPGIHLSSLLGSLRSSAGGCAAVPGDLRISNSLRSELESEVAEIFKSAWDERDGYVVPDEESINLGNDAVKLEATVLYADLADSTKLVDGHPPSFAAEIYKAFLGCGAKIIRSEDGEITAYDGDRIMAVYLGDKKNTRAVRTAMKIKHVVSRVIDPAVRAQYGTTAYQVRHVIGIDTSSLFVAKTGARLANDLVWVGRAANYAAKLSALPAAHSTYITKDVYDVIHSSVKTSSDGRPMWEPVLWNSFDNRTIYRSTWGFSFS